MANELTKPKELAEEFIDLATGVNSSKVPSTSQEKLRTGIVLRGVSALQRIQDLIESQVAKEKMTPDELVRAVNAMVKVQSTVISAAAQIGDYPEVKAMDVQSDAVSGKGTIKAKAFAVSQLNHNKNGYERTGAPVVTIDDDVSPFES